jgi:predicted O-linked N-acetylglucosamine transferase (SPINDLY family)
MPTVTEILTYGLAAHRTGKLDIAENAYRQILEFDQNQPDALYFMAVLDSQMGRHGVAIERLGRALLINGRHAGYRLAFADALAGLGRTEEAIAGYHQVLALQADAAPALVGLGTALHRLGRFAEAVPHYKRALALGQVEYEDLENLGVCAISLGDFAGAAEAFWRAATLRPGEWVMHGHLGIALQWLGRRAEALQRYRLALTLDPNFGDARLRVGLILFGQGDVAAAVAEYREVLRRTPDHAEAHRAYLQCMPLLSGFDPRTILAERRRWSDRYARPIEERAIAAEALVYDNDRDPERRLRVAYMGGGTLFGTTVVHTMLPLLEAHDRTQVEIFCYSDLVQGQEDRFTERYRAVADHWRPTVALSDAAVAAMVRRDRIDLLVDLIGHMGGPRVLVFAHRPAPVQASLYTTTTTGQAGYDYLLADGRLIPPAQEDAFSEEVVRLPFGYLFQPQMPLPPVAPAPATLNGGRITFGSMNSLVKISDRSVALWARILAAVPGARLLMKGESFKAAEARQLMIERFAAHGVAPAQLDLREPTPSYRAYIELFNEIDVALDSLPYNGITTSCEALWMGVPVVTLVEERMVARYGLLLLGAVGIEDCIAHTEDEYVAKATALAGDLDRIRALRQSLRDRLARSPLNDAVGCARAVEAAYRQLWRRWCRGDGPAHGHGR